MVVRSKLGAFLMLGIVAALLSPALLSAQLTQPLGELTDAFKWRSIGPVNTSGRVTDVEGIPCRPSSSTGNRGRRRTTSRGNSPIPFRSAIPWAL